MNLNGANSKEAAANALLNWLEKTYPGSKSKILKRAQGSLGADETTTPAAVPWYEKLLNAAKEVIPVYYQYKSNKQITDLQMNRANQGLAPLDVSQYSAPPVTVQHTFDNQISPDTKTALMIGGGILGAIILLPMLTGGGGGGSSRAPARRRK
jgi:hypothetical protein